jgi:hypothetical protein
MTGFLFPKIDVVCKNDEVCHVRSLICILNPPVIKNLVVVPGRVSLFNYILLGKLLINFCHSVMEGQIWLKRPNVMVLDCWTDAEEKL